MLQGRPRVAQRAGRGMRGESRDLPTGRVIKGE